MLTLATLYSLENPKKLLTSLVNSDILIKFGENRFETDYEKEVAVNKIKTLVNEKTQYPIILLRGLRKSKLKEKFIATLNSNYSLYDALFLVGEKAKNFLEKSGDIPHPIKNINSVSKKTTSWIFKKYSELTKAPIDLKYFKNVQNKKHFTESLKGKALLIDYYLFGLHTNNSATLVNFVSTTLSPQTALYNETTDKLIIFLWLTKNFDIYINSDKLNECKKNINEMKLPILHESFHPNEIEFSFKGFILPHFIIGIHDIDENALILNPSLLRDKNNWIDDGLNVNQENFTKFIKTTAYKRFL